MGCMDSNEGLGGLPVSIRSLISTPCCLPSVDISASVKGQSTDPRDTPA